MQKPHARTGMFGHMGTQWINTALNKKHDVQDLQATCSAAAIRYAFTLTAIQSVYWCCTAVQEYILYLRGSSFLCRYTRSRIFPSLEHTALTRHWMLAAVWGRPRRHAAVQDQTSSHGCNSHVRKEAEWNINMQLMALKRNTPSQKCGQASHLHLNRLNWHTRAESSYYATLQIHIYNRGISVHVCCLF